MAEFFDYDDSDMFLDETLLILEVWRFPFFSQQTNVSCRDFHMCCFYTSNIIPVMQLKRGSIPQLYIVPVLWLARSLNI